MSWFTVVGYYEVNGDIFVKPVEAESGIEAYATVAELLQHSDLVLVACFESVLTSEPPGDKACAVQDFPWRELKG